MNLSSVTTLHCVDSSTCPYLFNCVDNVCQHIPVLPPTIYTGIVYVLLGFGIMFVNIGGLSAGTMKVPVLMDLLGYPVSQATALSYPLVTGAALANFIQLVPKRHPTKDTSLVDYNVVLILLPSVVYGTTMGVFIVKFIPALVQDIILIIVFSLFAVYFYNKLKEARRVYAIQSKKNDTQLKAQNSTQQTKRQEQHNIQDSLLEVPEQLQQHLNYEKTFHLRDILINFAAFLIFQILSSLVQGKFVKFSVCSTAFAFSFPCFTLVYLAYAYIVRMYTRRKMDYYRRIEYKYDLELDRPKVFYTLLGAGFFGGLTQGIVGVGSGNLMVIGILKVGALQAVASATSGFSILFVGMASLIQAIITGILTAEEIILFFGVAFVIGGSLTYLGYQYLKTRASAAQKVLLAIMCICLLSVFGTIPSLVLTAHYYGWAGLLSISWDCP